VGKLAERQVFSFLLASIDRHKLEETAACCRLHFDFHTSFYTLPSSVNSNSLSQQQQQQRGC